MAIGVAEVHIRQKSYCREFDGDVFDVDVTTENGRVYSYPGILPLELSNLMNQIQGGYEYHDRDEPIDVGLSRLADEYDATTRQTAKLLNVPTDSFRALIGGPDLKIIRPDLDAALVRGCVWGTFQFGCMFRDLYKEVDIEFLQDKARPEWEQYGCRVKPDGLPAEAALTKAMRADQGRTRTMTPDEIPPEIGRVEARSFCECQPPVNARMWLENASLEKELDFGIQPLLFPPPHDVIISVWPETAPYEGKASRVSVIVHGCPQHKGHLKLSLQQAVRLAELLREAADEAGCFGY